MVSEWNDGPGHRRHRGIGHAIVSELAAFGAAVHTCSRTQTELDKCLQDWHTLGFRVTGSLCDVSSPSQRDQLIRQVSSTFDAKLNIYVILLIPSLPTCEKGSIVFISSVAGVLSLATGSVYAASKAAINQLTKTLACEWAKDNIRTNCVVPWATRTPLLLKDPKFVDDIMSRTPIKRIAEPEEVSSLVTFLSLPAASYITGQFSKLVNLDESMKRTQYYSIILQEWNRNGRT
ncbi:hypothetical protein VNO78_28201 [Psophocarpus tetragonolobus]|uniref:Uncharacterized protein n=1 Tax=Psophocarpus tetragonolobus TaxID=3891 RepID=A0AAN9S1W6_PSOTE